MIGPTGELYFSEVVQPGVVVAIRTLLALGPLFLLELFP